MMEKRRIFPYTLSARDYTLWKLEGAKGRAHITKTAIRRARCSGRNVALILAPNGQLLDEVTCG